MKRWRTLCIVILGISIIALAPCRIVKQRNLGEEELFRKVLRYRNAEDRRQYEAIDKLYKELEELQKFEERGE